MQNFYNIRLTAPACSITLHAGLLAWMLYPAPIPQMHMQIVDVSIVRLSSPAQSQSQPAAQPKSDPAPRAEKAETKPENRPAQKTQTASATPPTTGKQSPTATKTIAASNPPLYAEASLHNTPPAYPASARARGIEGKVLLEVDVSPEGSARDVAITASSGYALLDNAAQGAIRTWRFIPASNHGQSIEARIEIPIEFRLE